MTLNDMGISYDIHELLSGNKNPYSREYTESKDTISSGDSKSLGKLKNFMTNIESVAKKSVDSDIAASKGDVTKYKGHDDLKTILDSKDLGDSLSGAKELYKSLISNKDKYVDGYSKGIRLIVLEYESVLYAVIVQSLLKSTKKDSQSSIIDTTVSKLKSQVTTGAHSKYLDSLIKIKDSDPIGESTVHPETLVESSVGETINLISATIRGVSTALSHMRSIGGTILRSALGILPLIRIMMYLRYKNKANKVMALQKQAEFIRFNVESLKKSNTTGMTPEQKKDVIKKQEAKIEQYMKLSEKLRAELMDGEREANEAIKESEPDLKKDNSSDEWVLESFDTHNMNEFFSGGSDDLGQELTVLIAEYEGGSNEE